MVKLMVRQDTALYWRTDEIMGMYGQWYTTNGSPLEWWQYLEALRSNMFEKGSQTGGTPIPKTRLLEVYEKIIDLQPELIGTPDDDGLLRSFDGRSSSCYHNGKLPAGGRCTVYTETVGVQLCGGSSLPTTDYRLTSMPISQKYWDDMPYPVHLTRCLDEKTGKDRLSQIRENLSLIHI